MKIAFTGGRNYAKRDLVTTYLREEVSRTDTVLVGDCPTGLDNFVRTWCLNHQQPMRVFAANWDEFGKAAGPLRNLAMLKHGAGILIAWPGGKGTRSCIVQARGLGISVLYMDATDPSEWTATEASL